MASFILLYVVIHLFQCHMFMAYLPLEYSWEHSWKSGDYQAWVYLWTLSSVPLTYAYPFVSIIFFVT